MTREQVIPEDALEAAWDAFDETGDPIAALSAAAPYLMASAYDEALDEVAGSYMFRSDAEELKEENPHRKARK